MAGGLANFAVMYFVQPLLPLLVTEYGVSTSDSAHALSITTATIILGCWQPVPCPTASAASA